MKNVIAWVIDIRTMASRRDIVDVDDIARFRSGVFSDDTIRSYPGAHRLAKDEWDFIAHHVLCFHHGQPVGAARVIPFSSLGLPLQKNVEELEIGEDDTEMGRFLISPLRRNGMVISGLLLGCGEIYRTFAYQRLFGGAIFADVVTEGKGILNDRSYRRLGFQRLPIQYFDTDYAANCNIYRMDKSDRRLLMNYIHMIASHYRLDI